MQNRPLYMDDSYVKEFDAVVTSAEGNSAVLDNTAFFPAGGGVACDKGWIVKGDRFEVVSVAKKDGKILHNLSSHSLGAGDSVRGILDWNRRYKLMRMHTAAHLLSSIFYSDLGVLVTGNQLDVDRSRIDYSLEAMDIEAVKKIFEKANALIGEDMKVKIFYLPREEALKIPGVVKLAGALPPSVDELRIVEIDGVDVQADGGCHVASLSEIGAVDFVKAENKGKNNRRVYYTVVS